MASDAFVFTPEQTQLLASLSHATGTSIPLLMAKALCLLGAKIWQAPSAPASLNLLHLQIINLPEIIHIPSQKRGLGQHGGSSDGAVRRFQAV